MTREVNEAGPAVPTGSTTMCVLGFEEAEANQPASRVPDSLSELQS